MQLTSVFLESSPIACSALVEASGHKYFVTFDRVTGDCTIHGVERSIPAFASVLNDFPMDFEDFEIIEAAAATAVLQLFAATA